VFKYKIDLLGIFSCGQFSTESKLNVASAYHLSRIQNVYNKYHRFKHEYI